MSVYVANTKLYVTSTGAIGISGSPLAFNTGDIVPDATVTRDGLVAAGLVTSVAGTSPVSVYPVTLVQDPAGALSDGVVPEWDTTTSKWIPGTALSSTAANATYTQHRPGHVICTVPTYDADANAGHPSVVEAPNGVWNGYRYWMAFTPFPTDVRENPSIVASNDGVTWTVPSGLTNPVFSVADAVAAGLAKNSDPDLCFSADGLTLYLFHRPFKDTATVGESVLVQSSTTGSTWTAATVAVAGTAGEATHLLSPSVLALSSSSYVMWTVDVVAVPGVVKKRTSSSPTSGYSAPSSCTLPTGVDPWHIDVNYVDGVYYMLVHDKTDASLTILTSSDGTTWTGGGWKMPTSGTSYDARGFYRATMVPAAGRPLAWDIWATMADNTGATVWDDHWRIGLFSAVDARGVVGVTTTQTITGLKTYQPQSAGTIGVIVKGAAAQTAALQEWRNSAGTVLASVTAAGIITGQNVQSVGDVSTSTGAFVSGTGTDRLRMIAAAGTQYIQYDDTLAFTNVFSGTVLAQITNTGTLSATFSAGLRAFDIGAADSGGAGFRMVRVAN